MPPVTTLSADDCAALTQEIKDYTVLIQNLKQNNKSPGSPWIADEIAKLDAHLEQAQATFQQQCGQKPHAPIVLSPNRIPR